MNEPFVSPIKATGWRILIDPIEIQTHYKGQNIELPRSMIEAQEYLRYVAKVVDIGPLAFQTEQFKDEAGASHPACEVGDWIIHNKHGGADVFIQEDDEGSVRQLKLINDDQVLGIATDIEKVKIPLA